MEYLSWKNRYFIGYGQGVEAILCTQAFGHITIEEFEVFKKDLFAFNLIQ